MRRARQRTSRRSGPCRTVAAVPEESRTVGEQMNHPMIDYEEADDLEGQVAAIQRGINEGSIWLMQGSAGRAAMDFMRAGYCTLGEESHRDYWGNYVPSRTEVKPGTLGSIEYCQDREWGQA